MPTLARLSLLILSASLLWLSFTKTNGQDWLPFQAASGLAAQGLFSDLYLPAAASSLTDVTARFDAEATALLGARGESITAFISPPPALFLGAPLGSLPWEAALPILRLCLCLPLLLALFLQTKTHTKDPAVSLLWVLSLPLLSYALLLGQPTVWLVPAVLASLLAPSRWGDVIGGLCLALGVLCKGSPLILLPALFWLGHRRMALLSLGVTLFFVLLSLLLLPWEIWGAFLRSSELLSQHTISDRYNLSPEAWLTLLEQGEANPLWQQTSALARWGGLGLRLFALGGCAVLMRTSGASRVALLWLMWLALTPMTWPHYLLVLVPVFGHTRRGRRAGSLWMGLFFAVFLLRGPLSLFSVGVLLGPVYFLGFALAVWGVTESGRLLDDAERASI